MIENKDWFDAGAGRRPGLDGATDEPSHIHLPRRRRGVRPDDRVPSAARSAYVGDEGHRRHARLAAEEA